MKTSPEDAGPPGSVSVARKGPARLLALLAMAVYAACLPLPAIYADNWAGPETFWTGLDVLAAGWLGLLEANIAWYANVLFLVGVVRLLLGRLARNGWIFLAAALVACDSYLLTEIWYNEGNPSPVKGLGPGFYLWIGDFLMASALSAWLQRRHAGPPSPTSGHSSKKP